MNSYFSHDSNARNDTKIIQLRMKYGAKGYGIYFMILERLRDDSNYMSIKDYNIIAFDLREDAAVIKDVVEEFGLFAFTDDGKCFYSESLNKRMALKDEAKKKKSEAGKKGARSHWGKNAKADPTDKNSNAIAVPSKKDNSAITPPRVSDSNISKESKVSKESNTSSPKSQKRTYEPDDQNYQLAIYMLKTIRSVNPNVYPEDSKNPPNLQSWANDIRLTHERDARSYEQIKQLIDWSQNDSFWNKNILSPAKLRKQFGKLISRAEDTGPSNYGPDNYGREPEYELPY